ncbi:hypothetical protein BFJ72_g9501 [Fusarium proliferatum]|uniref:Nephrocystin 3-like N-terminal domain-containing protein n=1 Tax=Gibberella intermedia TaxID=948311 RepID=A0A420SXN7_GIBIN|nr:hypothetical protein BFJ72_g9501 [Fusarium proliferatum]
MASPMNTDAQQSSFVTSKRPRAYSENSIDALQHEDYTIGWISALPLEMTAAEIMLDHIHQPLPQDPQDGNAYTLGSINEHNIVIACLPKGQYGTNNAATVANDMARSFPKIQHRLMVGIGGAAPKLADVRLGDIVVSTEVVQSDLGKQMPNGQFHRTSHPVRPPHSLMTAVSKLQASHTRGQNQISAIISGSVSRLTHFARPNIPDRLFKSDYHHTVLGSCDSCDQSQLVSRPARPNTDPFIHYGRIASGNQVIKDTITRDKLSEELGVICFEMEAAGLMNGSPYLVIRGICDYSDSHKNKKWQEHAALMAAAYTKEVVMAIPFQASQSWKRRRTQNLPSPEPTDPGTYCCLRALFVTDSSLDREGILDAKGDICEGSCEWILSTDEFRAWDKDPPHLLWISAPPGMGKTFLSIYLSKHFEITANGPETATIFFFCDDKIDTRNTAVSILRGLMYQLISHQPNLVNTIMPQWKQHSKQLFEEKSFGTLWKLFEDAIAQSDFRTIYCVIDALDECEASSLCLLLRKFERLSRRQLGSSPEMKLICLSRRYPENIPEALLWFAKMELDIMSSREYDIGRFISYQVQELAEKKKLNLEMRSLLEKTFKEKSEGTFLWVSFMSQDLQKKRLLDFEESLRMLPAGLDAVYRRVLQTVELEKTGIIHDILYWILVAKRPFSIPELCEAIDMKPTRILTREEVCIELIKSCGHLLEITNHTSRENGPHQRVTFLHQSAKDYLMKFDPRFGSQIPGVAHPQLHEDATIFLIQYLEKIMPRKVTEEDALHNAMKHFPLARYAVTQWVAHFRELEDITQVMQQCMNFFKQNSKVRGMWQHLHCFPRIFTSSKPVPLLHLSAILALDSLAQWCLRHDGRLLQSPSLLRWPVTDVLLRMLPWSGATEHHVETRWGTMEQTALFVACLRHREHIISWLLDAGADPIPGGILASSALEAALLYCDRRVLQLMARTEPCRKFFIKQASDEDGGLICGAACAGNEEACRFFIEDLGWDLNWQCGSVGYAALSCALLSGNFELISCFIKQWQVPIKNHSEVLKKACYSLRADNSFERLIQLLVDHCSIDINATDDEGQNALFFVFQHYNVRQSSVALYGARTLLQFGCSPDQPDCLGETAMHCLTEQALYKQVPSFLSIMDLLVSRSQHGINQVYLDGQTLLHYLIENWLIQPTLGRIHDMCGTQVARDLMNLGVARHIRNSQGLTALQMLQAAQGQLKSIPGRRGKRYRAHMYQMMLLLDSYCTVPKY